MKKVLAGALACSMIFGSMAYNPVSENVVITANASETGTYENFTYEKYNDYIEITGCDTSETEVIIPSEIDGLPVTSIGEWAFHNCSDNIEKIIIPDTVTSISKDRLFMNCYKLKEIEVDSDNANYTSIDGILFNKDITELVAYPQGYRDGFDVEYKIPDTVTVIGSYAFANCNYIANITIPNGVTSIEEGAFLGTGLTEIIIPESVTSIDEYVFNSCSKLTKITVESNNANYTSIDGVLFNKEATELIVYPYKKAENEYIVPDSVIVIGKSAFQSSDTLTKVTISDNVTNIGDYAFFYCDNLAEVIISDSVTSIGSSAFSWCKSLTQITIPENVTTIEYEAFSYCENLTEVTIPNSVTSIGSQAFRNCTALTEITIPESVTSIETSAFTECSSLTKATILNYKCDVFLYPDTICNGYDEDGNYYFDGIIYGYTNSPAQTYADTYGYNFVSIGESPETTTTLATAIVITKPTAVSIPNTTTTTTTTTITTTTTDIIETTIIGDVNGDNVINASDASEVLSEYALLSSGGTATLDLTSADVNGDGVLNSSDASSILAYYAYISSGGTDTIEDYLNS